MSTGVGRDFRQLFQAELRRGQFVRFIHHVGSYMMLRFVMVNFMQGRELEDNASLAGILGTNPWANDTSPEYSHLARYTSGATLYASVSDRPPVNRFFTDLTQNRFFLPVDPAVFLRAGAAAFLALMWVWSRFHPSLFTFGAKLMLVVLSVMFLFIGLPAYIPPPSRRRDSPTATAGQHND